MTTSFWASSVCEAADNTYTVADNINGGAGKDTLSLTSAGTTASPTTVTVTNVEVVSIRDLVGSTFDATLVSNNPAINFTDTARRPHLHGERRFPRLQLRDWRAKAI